MAYWSNSEGKKIPYFLKDQFTRVIFLSLENSAEEMGMSSALLAAMQPDGFCHTLAVAGRYTLI